MRVVKNMQTNLSYDLSITDAKIKCDTQCKKILSQKIILAWILKYSTPEFSDLDISEILSCIEGEPEISSIGVLPGHTNHPSSGNDQISGMSNEEKELTLMCNYSDYVEKRGIEKGIAKGMEKGMELGKRELIDSLLRNKLLPDDVIAGISGYSLEKIQSIRLELELIQ